MENFFDRNLIIRSKLIKPVDAFAKVFCLPFLPIWNNYFVLVSSIVKVARKMTTFNPPPPKKFGVPLYLTLLTPKGVKAPTFSGTHVLRGVKIGNFPATLWKREWN